MNWMVKFGELLTEDDAFDGGGIGYLKCLQNACNSLDNQF